MPRTKLFPKIVKQGYAPAPLDYLSLYAGAAKFVHPQYTISNEAYDYIWCVLLDLFPSIRYISKVATDEEVTAELVEHREKSAGYPWIFQSMVTKGAVLEKIGLSGIEKFYREQTSIVESTVKDEIRLVGKDARLFRPADISAYVEGCRLFYHQNSYLMTLFMSPIFCKYVTPGRDLTDMYEKILEHEGLKYNADGSQWDTRFPLFVAEIIAKFRSQGLDEDRVTEYYRRMYNGYTHVDGFLMHLIGNPSGHYNTTVDNCLCHIVLMSYCAFLCGITIERFLTDVLFFCCGDDLIYSDRTGLFDSRSVFEKYRSVGVYLEFKTFDPVPFTQNVFVSTRPVFVKRDNFAFLSYTYIFPKLRASLEFAKVHRNAIQKLGKLCSICQLCFFDDVNYQYCRNVLMVYVTRCVLNGEFNLCDPEVGGLLQSVEPEILFRSYTMME